ncbi:hypothetical protein BpHYR1_009498, partial [Brachionus plicatilis]
MFVFYDYLSLIVGTCWSLVVEGCWELVIGQQPPSNHQRPTTNNYQRPTTNNQQLPTTKKYQQITSTNNKQAVSNAFKSRASKDANKALLGRFRTGIIQEIQCIMCTTEPKSYEEVGELANDTDNESEDIVPPKKTRGQAKVTETHEDFEFMFSTVKNLSKQLFDFDFDTDTLLADDAMAITNGFKSVFTNLKNRIVCWAHRRRNMDDFFKSLGEVLQKEKVEDINFFQASVLKEHFETVYNLLKTKWTSRNVANIINMFDHCDQYWLSEYHV